MIPRVIPFKFQESTDRPNYHPLKIKPTAGTPENHRAEFGPLIDWIQKSVEEMVSVELLDRFYQPENQDYLPLLFQELFDKVPFFYFTIPDTAPGALKVSLLCQAIYTHGVGRFFCDIASRWIVPGKSLSIHSSTSLNFRFVKDPGKQYFFQQMIAQIDNEKELKIIRSHLPSFLKDLQLTISTAQYLRKLVNAYRLSPDQKTLLIQNHVETLMDHPSHQMEPSLFDRMHHLLVQASAEAKIKQIQEHAIPLEEQKPYLFDADLFYEIQHTMALFRDPFLVRHDQKHLIRLMTSFCLFRRALKQQVRSNLQHRHVMMRVFRAKVDQSSNPRSVVGVLVGMNTLCDNEIFDQKHLFEAIQHCADHPIRPIEGSFIVERLDVNDLRLFYLEVEKQDLSPFKKEELKKIKSNLVQELKSSIENVTHTIFMPRNEEEVMRSILLLNQELRYVRDIPQVVINFDRQTEGELLFTVILARILQSHDVSLSELFSHHQTPLRFQNFDVKSIGYLRKKYRKEANVFTALIDKKRFMRKDFSIDLFKARQFISSEIGKILGDIRDFNGGILSKQHELFHELKQLLMKEGPLNEFLLENFFYSIIPYLMQSILPPTLLKTLYLTLLEGIEHNFKKHLFFLKSHWTPEYLLILAASPRSSIKEALDLAVQSLAIPASDICSTHIKAYDISAVGYIYHCEDVEKCSSLYNTIEKILCQWEKDQMAGLHF